MTTDQFGRVTYADAIKKANVVILDNRSIAAGHAELALDDPVDEMCCDTTAREAVHRGFKVEFLSDATGTLPLNNKAGQVTAEELHRSILCAQQMLLSDVISSKEWLSRISDAK